MAAGVLILNLFSDSVHSLKEKRSILKSMQAKLNKKFCCSVAETDHQDSWQKAEITIAIACSDITLINKNFKESEEFILANYPVRILSKQEEYLK